MSLAAGDAARREDGTLGVVCYGPDRWGDVKLLLEDGSTTDDIKASALARPSEAELAANLWATELLSDEDRGQVTEGTPLRRIHRVGTAAAAPADGTVRLTWADRTVSDPLPLAVLGREAELV